MLLNLILWLAGLIISCTGFLMIRIPLARYQQLQQTDQNLRRYESWRGGSRRTAVDSSGTSGADVMKAMMRRRVQLWAGAIVFGIVLVVLGFIIR
jgi:hypothetical protein